MIAEDDDRLVGDKSERVSSPSYNSGLFEALFQSKFFLSIFFFNKANIRKDIFLRCLLFNYYIQNK